ncbi:MAG: hypothetical protein EU530_00545 [Promethearchaeota archaeon]|nr:MAG: hypothetical protein EU530_00545 [Candidatus Lokiarchaeota archaeon]
MFRIYLLIPERFPFELFNTLSDISLIFAIIGLAISLIVAVFGLFLKKHYNTVEVKRFGISLLISIILDLIAIFYPILHNILVYNLVGFNDVLFELGPGIAGLLYIIASIIRIVGWKNFTKFSEINLSKKRTKGSIWIRIYLFIIVGMYSLTLFHHIVETLYLDAALDISQLYSTVLIMYRYIGLTLSILIPIFEITGHLWVGLKLQD